MTEPTETQSLDDRLRKYCGGVGLEAVRELSALRDRVAALEGALEDGIDQVNWINAQAENAMATVATVTASSEEGNVSLWMIDSIASDIGINAMMFTDKARSILSRAQQGGGDV